MRNVIVAFIAALLLGSGLGISGLLDPMTIRGFLDVTGDWNFGPLVVLGTAVVVYAIGYRLSARKIAAPRQVDRRLLAGATIFGIGWGLAGLCPGPAIAGLVFGKVGSVTFVAAMVFGGFLYRLVHERGTIKSSPGALHEAVPAVRV